MPKQTFVKINPPCPTFLDRIKNLTRKKREEKTEDKQKTEREGTWKYEKLLVLIDKTHMGNPHAQNLIKPVVY